MVLWLVFAASLGLVFAIGMLMESYPLAVRWTDEVSHVPRGVVDFELAGTRAEAQRIVNAWQSYNMHDNARPNILIDMLWVPCYAAALASACLLIGAALSDAPWALVAAWSGVALTLAAAALDLVEDFAMLSLLDELSCAAGSRTGDRLSALVSVCARMKFAMLLVVLFLVAAGALTVAARWEAQGWGAPPW